MFHDEDDEELVECGGMSIGAVDCVVSKLLSWTGGGCCYVVLYVFASLVAERVRSLSDLPSCSGSEAISRLPFVMASIP